MLLLARLNPRVATAVRLIGLVLIGWTVLGSHPGPGGSGRGLVVAISLAASAAAFLGWIATTLRPQIVSAELYLLAVAGGLLTGAAPGSAASAFVFIAVVAAAARAELRRAVPVAVTGTISLAVADLLYNDSALGLLAYGLGFAAALLAAANVRQSVVRADQAELLLAQSQRSHEEQLRAARLEESTRIAREIHDLLAHALAGLTIQLEATASLVEQDSVDREQLLERLRRAHALAREGLVETRRAVGALRGEREPVQVSVREAIEALLADHRAASDAPLELAVDGQPERLSPAARDAVVRVLQEALTNVRKHAPGAAVAVSLQAGAEAHEPIVLIVSDRHAAGRAPALGGELAASGGGFGLRGMRERAAELGGTLRAGAVEGGWHVELRLPPSVALELPAETVG